MTDRESAAAPPENAEQPLAVVLPLAAASAAWTAAMLWSARAKITSYDDALMEVTSTAYALPGVVSAALVAGAAVALAALTLLARRRAPGATARFAVATGAGLAVGLLSALPILTINTAGSMYATVAGTVAAAATIGGALAGFRLPPVIAAAGWASVCVFLLGLALNLRWLQDPALDLLGAGDTAASQTSAARWFSFGQAALAGVTAGLVAYAILRRARRGGGTDLRWPFFALAGAGPGLILIVAEALARTAGARVLELAGKVSVLEESVQRMLSTARLNSAMIVLFIGALTAIFAIGRKLSPATDPDDGAARATPQSEAALSEAAPSQAAADTPAAERG